MVQDGAQDGPRWLKMAQDLQKMAQDDAQDGLSWPEMAPDGRKLAQDGLKMAPRRLKMAQDGPKLAPTTAKDGSRCPRMVPKMALDDAQDGPRWRKVVARCSQHGSKMTWDALLFSSEPKMIFGKRSCSCSEIVEAGFPRESQAS